MAFLPCEPRSAQRAVDLVEEIASEEGLVILGWREMPVELSAAGEGARAAAPSFRRSSSGPRPVRAGAGRRCAGASVLCRSQARGARRPRRLLPVVVDADLRVQGDAGAHQLRAFFPDLTDERLESRIVLGTRGSRPTRFPPGPRAPVPARRTQRRDQHPRGQPELDARQRGVPGE